MKKKKKEKKESLQTGISKKQQEQQKQTKIEKRKRSRTFQPDSHTGMGNRMSLETVKRTLLLLLIERIHPLFQLRPGSLGLTTRTPLLLDSLERSTLGITLLTQRPQLLFHLEGLLLPRLAV